MKLFTEQILRQMRRENAERQEPVKGTESEIDHVPVVKIFNPCGSATWLLTEIDTEDPDNAFGLCDLGMGCPEIGSVRISELESVKGVLGIGLERDLYFDPKGKTLMEYPREAWDAGHIKA